MVNVAVDMAATLWEAPMSDQPYVLVTSAVLFFGDTAQESPLTPNLLRANGLCG